MMDLADIIVIVIIDNSHLIYGRNVRCWRQADIDQAESRPTRCSINRQLAVRRQILSHERPIFQPIAQWLNRKLLICLNFQDRY
jgi:hypothetical protein